MVLVIAIKRLKVPFSTFSSNSRYFGEFDFEHTQYSKYRLFANLNRSLYFRLFALFFLLFPSFGLLASSLPFLSVERCLAKFEKSGKFH